MLISLIAVTSVIPDVTLSGIVLTRSGRHAATLRSDGRARPVVAGDRAFGCEVASIQEGRVDIICAGVRQTLRLATAPAPLPAANSVSAEAVSADPPADVTMDRTELEARLDREMSRLMTETTLIPVTSRGQVSGFTLSRIPAGTVLETLGLQAGDTLVSVNETPIDSFTTLVGLWPQLKTSGTIRAQVMRDGKPLDITVSIR